MAAVDGERRGAEKESRAAVLGLKVPTGDGMAPLLTTSATCRCAEPLSAVLRTRRAVSSSALRAGEGGMGGDSENESRGPKILGAMVIAARAATVSIVSGICAASSPTTPVLRMRCRQLNSLWPEAGW